ncbi:unnamed protein product, partial [Rotaria socialis]
SNLIRFVSSSSSRCSATSKSATESAIADDEIRRNLLDNITVARDSFNHVQLYKLMTYQ